MNPTAAITLEVQSLIEAVCDGMADDAQVRDLESLMLTDEATCNFYVDMLDLDAKLQRLVGSLQEGASAFKEFVATEQTPSFSPSPLPTFLSATFPATLGYSSGWAMSYLLATVLTGLLILGFWLMPVSRPEQVATHSLPPAAEREIAPEPLPASVGRITGTVDCKRPGDSRVSLGQKLNLAAGLMEITYDTGAKVILQAPVTYEVEANGGYLTVGRLTGKLEKGGGWRVAGGVRDEEPPIRDSFPPPTTHHPPPFTVRTPTATVTDLGTQFGVEVTKNQQTRTHVFQGRIVVRSQEPAASAAHAPREIQLGEGESASVTPQGTVIRLTGAQARATATTIDFVRTIPKGTGTVFSYDFEVPSLRPGDLLGQDGWTGHTMTNPSLRVMSGTGLNCTQVIAGVGGGGANCRRFKWCRNWLLVTPGMIVTEEFWAYAAKPQTTHFVMGAWWAGDSNPSGALFGISAGKWYVREAVSPGHEYAGDGGIRADHWYNVKLAIDFAAPGGLATLYRRDVTAGEKTFVQDSILRNVEMRIPMVPWAPPAGRYEIMGISAWASGNGAGDNFSIRVDRVGQADPPDESRTSSKTGVIARQQEKRADR